MTNAKAKAESKPPAYDTPPDPKIAVWSHGAEASRRTYNGAPVIAGTPLPHSMDAILRQRMIGTRIAIEVDPADVLDPEAEPQTERRARFDAEAAARRDQQQRDEAAIAAQDLVGVGVTVSSVRDAARSNLLHQMAIPEVLVTSELVSAAILIEREDMLVARAARVRAHEEALARDDARIAFYATVAGETPPTAESWTLLKRAALPHRPLAPDAPSPLDAVPERPHVEPEAERSVRADGVPVFVAGRPAVGAAAGRPGLAPPPSPPLDRRAPLSSGRAGGAHGPRTSPSRGSSDRPATRPPGGSRRVEHYDWTAVPEATLRRAWELTRAKVGDWEVARALEREHVAPPPGYASWGAAPGLAQHAGDEYETRLCRRRHAESLRREIRRIESSAAHGGPQRLAELSDLGRRLERLAEMPGTPNTPVYHAR